MQQDKDQIFETSMKRISFGKTLGEQSLSLRQHLMFLAIYHSLPSTHFHPCMKINSVIVLSREFWPLPLVSRPPTQT